MRPCRRIDFDADFLARLQAMQHKATAATKFQQVIIGVSLGFALQILFDAVAMGGQLLANSMGLSFAFNVDPMRAPAPPPWASYTHCW